ncbi:hypothetical protein [Streptacidiphilus sp. EB129]|uniref:hypothetical protein n=1 Tax=Streptacidiphilus sp. EB129 TaxID=3156262 RepID=UPI0035172828
MKVTAYWCLITIQWTSGRATGQATMEGEYFVRRPGTTVREVFHEFQRQARGELPDEVKSTAVCWDIQPLKLPQRRWFQRGDRVTPGSTTVLPSKEAS